MRGNIFQPIAAAAGQPANPNISYEIISRANSGLAVQSGAANTLGSWVSCGTLANAVSALEFDLAGTSGAAIRYQWSVRKNGTTVIVPDLYVSPGANHTVHVSLPVLLPATTTLEIAVRSDQASQFMRVPEIRGVIASSTLPPGFATMASITTPDTGTTKAQTSGITINSYANHVADPQTGPWTDDWTQLVASTAHNMEAFLLSLGIDSAAPTGQRVQVLLGVGAADAEVEIGSFGVLLSNSTPQVAGGLSPVIFHHVPAGSRLSAKVIGETAGGILRLGGWEFH